MEAAAKALETTTPTSRDPGRWKRRAITFPAIFVLAAIAAGVFPAALALAFLVDLVRWRRFALARCVLFFTGYLAGEVAFISLGVVEWALALGNHARVRRWAHGLSRGWGLYLDRFGRWCFSVKLDVTGRDALHPGAPAICFTRHVSVADNLFAPCFFACEAGYDLRYVAKHELQNDPIFDLIGNRLNSVFVRRASGDAEREIAAVVSLLDGMGPSDAIIIFPEGTRFSDGKRKKILASIERRGDTKLLARARALEHVLPPNLGGPIALLEQAQERGLELDLLFAFHAGYEGAATFSDLVQGRAIGRHVRVHFERLSIRDLPRGREALSEWFFQQWEKLDKWVGAELPRVLFGVKA